MVIEGVKLTPLEIITTPAGDVLHGLKSNDPGYIGFGEAYFSTVGYGEIKAWKRHREMTLNLVVPIGKIRFVIYDDRENTSTADKFQSITLSIDNYQRLTVPPNVWVGFQGVEITTNMLLNIANIQHHPDEADRLELSAIKYNWEI